MEQGQSKEPFKDLEARLQKAKSKTETYKAEQADQNESPSQGWGFAFRIGTELVSALAVGVGIGWALDYWLGTKPWLMVLFFFLGAGAGILNVYRVASGIGYSPTYVRPDTKAADTADEELKGDPAPTATEPKDGIKKD